MPRCRVCGGCVTEDLGVLLTPDPPVIAGVPLDLDGMTFRLLRCRQCGFQFRSPDLPADRLIACYEAADAEHYGDEINCHARFIDVMEDMIRRHTSGRRILDVGCFNAAVLGCFGKEWERFGLEPSAAAAAMAERRGVKVLGETLADLPTGTPPFDAVLLLNVAEHVTEPVPLMRAIRDCLRPGGVALIQTGDTDAWTWRVEKSIYWYTFNLAHVSFYNRHVMEMIGRQIGMRIAELQRHPFHRRPLKTKVYEYLKNAGYLAGRGVGGLGIPRLQRLFVERGAPSWMTSADHMYCLMQRADDSTASR